MIRIRIFIFIIFVIFFLPRAYAQNVIKLSCRNALSAEDINRVRTSKSLLGEVDLHSLQATLDRMENTGCPVMQVLMLESIANTYADLIQEYDLPDLAARERLYNKIQMNMAYLQFTGGQTKGDKSPLNRLIRRKLKDYFPQELLEHPAFFQSVE
jgi:hypothetical protein